MPCSGCRFPSRLTRDPVFVGGQSNGETLGAWGIGACNAANFANVAIGGSQMTTWAQGTSNYNAMLAAAQGMTPGVIFGYWIHGEGDSIAEANADAYETRLTAMMDNFEAEPTLSAYTIRWVVHELHDDLIASRAYQATVRAALLSVVAARSNAWSYDPNGFTLSADEVHYDLGDNAARQLGMDNVRMVH